ncbi:MAG: GNAT family N-acetyltransferase [Chloroflexota bacterium]|nr:GNAT family N-acetyltransferase [Chloroflexota bacterium]
MLDGTIVPFRRIEPSDAARLQRFHTQLSEQSIFQRHFGTVPTLSEEQARHLTHLDGSNRCALVALDPERGEEIIGVVRYDQDPGTAFAEYAAVVEDRWQGRGVGLQLTNRLVDAALHAGITQLYAQVLPTNFRMINLLRGLGLPRRTRREDGVERVEIDLRPRTLQVA